MLAQVLTASDRYPAQPRVQCYNYNHLNMEEDNSNDQFSTTTDTCDSDVTPTDYLPPFVAMIESFH